MTKAKSAHVERFADADLTGLREDLMKSGLDSWQAADLISSFLVACARYGGLNPRMLAPRPSGLESHHLLSALLTGGAGEDRVRDVSLGWLNTSEAYSAHRFWS